MKHFKQQIIFSMDVREYYNKILNQNLQDRSNDTHVNIHSNNFIKPVLLKNYVREGDNVLDLGCGKGGDLRRFDSSPLAGRGEGVPFHT